MNFMKLSKQECGEIFEKVGISDITYSTGRGCANTQLKKGFYGYSRRRGHRVHLAGDLDRLRLRAKTAYEYWEDLS